MDAATVDLIVSAIAIVSDVAITAAVTTVLVATPFALLLSSTFFWVDFFTSLTCSV